MCNYGYNTCYTPAYTPCGTQANGGFAFILVIFILLVIIATCGGFCYGC